MSWPGSPLPQLARPHRCQSVAEHTASIEPQNCGVTPAYEGLRSIRPSSPSLIS